MTQKVSRDAYMGLALSVLLLVGAGCASQTKLSVDANTPAGQTDLNANTETKEDAGSADAGSKDVDDAKEKIDANINAAAEVNVNGSTTMKGGGDVNVNTDGVNVNTKAGATAGAMIDVTKKESAPSAIEIKMEAKDFAFVPGEVRVKLGQKVRLIVTSTDVPHGIAIPAFNVHADLPVGQAVTVEFTADQKGSFPFFCSVFCGSGHRGMKGTLIVE